MVFFPHEVDGRSHLHNSKYRKALSKMIDDCYSVYWDKQKGVEQRVHMAMLAWLETNFCHNLDNVIMGTMHHA